MRYSLPIFALSAHLLFANPHGFKVLAGEASAPKETSSGLTIQSGSQAIIQWDHFSIDENRFVQFNQHDQNSAVLNRVVGGSESSLLGSLLSNGKVYLINPNGVLIGPNGRIETAGFLASTADVLNDDFLQGKELLFGDLGVGKIVHLGVIECPTGDVTLLARMIDAPGNIHAPKGTVLLLQPKGKPDIFIDAGGGGGAADQEGCALHQSGLIEALRIELKTSPNPYLKAIRCDGVLEAIEGVYIHAEEGLAEMNGAQIHCDSGTVHLLGESVFLNNDAKVDVSGDNKGGTILIGGDYKGENPDVPNADYLFAGSDTVLDARCRENGNGGKVILWGVKGNHAHGAIHAMGGPKGGDGGFVEISSLGDLQPTAKVSTLAPMGKTGTLLFDPCDVTIGATDNPCPANAPNCYQISTEAGVQHAWFTGTTADIGATALQTLLGSNNVTIDATASGSGGNGTITVSNNISWGTIASTLTLVGTGSAGITFSSGVTITNSNSGSNFNALVCSVSSGTIMIDTASSFQTTSGNMSFTATNTGSSSLGIVTTGTTLNSSGSGATAGSFTLSGTVSGTNSIGISMSPSNTNPISITTVDGNITITGTGTQRGVSMQNAGGLAAPITIETTGSTLGMGNITINGTASSSVALAGGFLIDLPGNPPAGHNITIFANVGNLAITGVNTTSGPGVLIESVSTSPAGSAVSITTTSGNLVIDGSTTGGASGTIIEGFTNIFTSTGNVTIQSANGTPTTVNFLFSNPLFEGTSGGNLIFTAPIVLTTTPIISTSGMITFSSTGTLNGAVPVTIAGGTTNFNGTVGGTTTLTSLTLTGTACNIGASITTTDDPDFTIPVAITNTSTITSSSTITFGSTLAVNAPLTLTPSGANTFSGVVTLISSLSSASALDFNAGVIVNSPGSTITGGGGISFASTLGVNGPLSLVPTGSSTFGGLVTLANNLTSTLPIALSGGASVTAPSTVTSTTGSITFGSTTISSALTLTPTTSSTISGAVTVSGASTITSTFGPITFGSTIDGANSLAITPTAAGVSFNGAIGGGTPLASFTVNGTTNQTAALAVTTASPTGNIIFTGPINAGGFGVNLAVTAASTAGNVQVANITGATTISLQPARTNTGSTPNGLLQLGGNLSASGLISLSPAGRSAVNVASIVSTFAGNNVAITSSAGSVTVGSNEAITVFGNLTVMAVTGITIGDVVASNQLTLTGGTNITVPATTTEPLLNLGGQTYTALTPHFFSFHPPIITPTPSGTVTTNAAQLVVEGVPTFQALLTMCPSTMLNMDASSIGIQLPPGGSPCNSCCNCAACNSCCSSGGGGSASSTRNIHPFGFIVNQEVVANSQLLELLPIFDREFYWPYYGVLCEGGDKANCVSPYFETFAWNNDVK